MSAEWTILLVSFLITLVIASWLWAITTTPEVEALKRRVSVLESRERCDSCILPRDSKTSDSGTSTAQFTLTSFDS